MAKPAFIFFTGLGVIALAVAAWLAKDVYADFSKGEVVSGKITQLEQSETLNELGRKVEYLPVFSFETEDGTPHQVVTEAGQGSYNRNAYRGGAEVKVWYQPGQEQDARIIRYSNVWMKPLAALIAAFVSFMAAVTFLPARAGKDKGRA